MPEVLWRSVGMAEVARGVKEMALQQPPLCCWETLALVVAVSVLLLRAETLLLLTPWSLRIQPRQLQVGGKVLLLYALNHKPLNSDCQH
jgi:hypothetical protein